MNRPIIALVALGIVASYWLLEQAYARADHRRAVELVRSYRIRAVSFEDYLLEAHAGRTADPEWSSSILSGCRGFVRVRCAIPIEGGTSSVYLFDVDLVRRSLHPADEGSRAAMVGFEEAGQKPEGASKLEKPQGDVGQRGGQEASDGGNTDEKKPDGASSS